MYIPCCAACCSQSMIIWTLRDNGGCCRFYLKNLQQPPLSLKNCNSQPRREPGNWQSLRSRAWMADVGLLSVGIAVQVSACQGEHDACMPRCCFYQSINGFQSETQVLQGQKIRCFKQSSTLGWCRCSEGLTSKVLSGILAAAGPKACTYEIGHRRSTTLCSGNLHLQAACAHLQANFHGAAARHHC